MKIALIGATGYVGAPILAEAMSRGHYVRALMRDRKKLAAMTARPWQTPLPALMSSSMPMRRPAPCLWRTV